MKEPEQILIDHGYTAAPSSARMQNMIKVIRAAQLDALKSGEMLLRYLDMLNMKHHVDQFIKIIDNDLYKDLANSQMVKFYIDAFSLAKRSMTNGDFTLVYFDRIKTKLHPNHYEYLVDIGEHIGILYPYDDKCFHFRNVHLCDNEFGFLRWLLISLESCKQEMLLAEWDDPQRKKAILNLLGVEDPGVSV